MKHTLYLECASGISGDMTVAALLDLGADEQYLRERLASLKLDGYTLEIHEVKKNGIRAKKFDVILERDEKVPESHDHGHTHQHSNDHGHVHAHQHKHSHKHEHGHGHSHGHSPEHDHSHNHGHGHGHTHSHADDHRNLAAVTEVLRSGSLTTEEVDLALRIFTIIAEAESHAHQLPIDQVHFHEVGAVDSIVDIAAAAICLTNLGIKDVIVTALNEGTGFVRCHHGQLPVPVPAVLYICETHGIPLRVLAEVEGEMITPTGAAIVAAIRTGNELPSPMKVIKSGSGAGTKDLPITNILRAMLIDG